MPSGYCGEYLSVKCLDSNSAQMYQCIRLQPSFSLFYLLLPFSLILLLLSSSASSNRSLFGAEVPQCQLVERELVHCTLPLEAYCCASKSSTTPIIVCLWAVLSRYLRFTLISAPAYSDIKRSACAGAFRGGAHQSPWLRQGALIAHKQKL